MGGGGTNKISESKEPSAPTEWELGGGLLIPHNKQGALWELGGGRESTNAL